MRICVIFNPTAQGDKARRFRESLDSFGDCCAIKPTTEPGAAWAMAAEAVREGYQSIIAAGGDGTVNEVLNGIGSEPNGFTAARLGILPIGTVNVFAQELNLPMRLHEAWKVILRGREEAIDLPRIEFSEGASARYFAQMAGCGWDARAIQLVSWELKKRFGQMAYVIAGLQALKNGSSQLTIAHDGGRAEGALVLIGNGRFYGGRIPIFRRANLQDGVLDVCAFPRVNAFVLARYALAFFSPRLLWTGSEIYFQTKSLEISASASTPVQVDGETVAHLPIRCALEPKRLRVIVP